MAVVLPLLFQLVSVKDCKSSSSKEDGFEVKITTSHLSQVEALGLGQISVEEMALCGSNVVASPHACHLLFLEMSSWPSPHSPAAFLAAELHQSRC